MRELNPRLLGVNEVGGALNGQTSLYLRGQMAVNCSPKSVHFSPTNRGALLKMAITVIPEDAYGYWPIQWNFGSVSGDGRSGPAIPDPDVFRITFTVFDEDDTCVDVRLSESIDALIDGETSPKTGKISAQEHVGNARAIRDHLRSLADKLDAAIERDA